MKTALITAAIASLAFAPAALASERFEVEFSYMPAEVATPEGAKATYEELEATIERECDPATSTRSIAERAKQKRCVDDAIENAVNEIDVPELTRIHEASRG